MSAFAGISTSIAILAYPVFFTFGAIILLSYPILRMSSLFLVSFNITLNSSSLGFITATAKLVNLMLIGVEGFNSAISSRGTEWFPICKYDINNLPQVKDRHVQMSFLNNRKWKVKLSEFPCLKPLHPYYHDIISYLTIKR